MTDQSGVKIRRTTSGLCTIFSRFPHVLAKTRHVIDVLLIPVPRNSFSKEVKTVFFPSFIVQQSLKSCSKTELSIFKLNASDSNARQKFGSNTKWGAKQEESLLARFGFHWNYLLLILRL